MNFLGKDFSIPGGTKLRYLSNTMIKLQPGAKLKEDKELGVKGFLVTVTIVKSRTSPAGSTVSLVFDQGRGFDNELSNYIFLKDVGCILGSGKKYYLKNLPNESFAQKDFKEKLRNKKFFAAYKELLDEELPKLILNRSVEDFSYLPAVEVDEEVYHYDEDRDIYVSVDGSIKFFFRRR